MNMNDTLDDVPFARVVIFEGGK